MTVPFVWDFYCNWKIRLATILQGNVAFPRGYMDNNLWISFSSMIYRFHKLIRSNSAQLCTRNFKRTQEFQNGRRLFVFFYKMLRFFFIFITAFQIKMFKFHRTYFYLEFFKLKTTKKNITNPL